MAIVNFWLTLVLLYLIHITGGVDCTCVTDKTLDGNLMKHPNEPAVYQIIDGCRRWVPNPPTYNNLYKTWSCIKSNILIKYVCNCDPLSNGAELVKGSGPAVYLLSNGVKRHIANPETFNSFCFDWNKIKTYSDIVIRNDTSCDLLTLYILA
ncbi:uncharacterized protein LOC106471120, partial [Limulus polyphemus]|uniref:Uncharacterized protein LOC106471120 n=1 Tax=Limulus polyphemus TaxID=6850 RepID=A0ABM1BRC1_LIMPO